MLDVSQIEEGRYGYEFKLRDVRDALSEAVKSYTERIKNKKIKFNFQQPRQVVRASVDERKLTLAFQNVLENAIDYTPENGQLDVTLVEVKDRIIVVFSDNGVGIPKSDQVRLFSKFFRGNNVVRLQTEGSGLGLFIVKNIIEKHNGTIQIESQEGIGTQVTIILPAG